MLCRFQDLIRREVAACKQLRELAKLEATISALIHGAEAAVAEGPQAGLVATVKKIVSSVSGGSTSGDEGASPDPERGCLRTLLSKEVAMRRARLEAQAPKPQARKAPCSLARSAVREDGEEPPLVSMGSFLNRRRVAKPQSLEYNQNKKESLWVSVFLKLREDSELHVDQLVQALEHSGYDRPNKTWIRQIFSDITEFTTLRKDEFVRFMADYEGQHRRALAEEFARFDTDNSGEVEMAEFADLLKSLGIEPMAHVLREVIVEVGAEGQGSLNFKEFELAMDCLRRCEGFTQGHHRMLLDMFRQVDRDGSGELDTKELAGMLSWMDITVGSSQLSKVVAAIDVDGSGTFNQREYMMLMRKLRDLEVTKVRSVMAENDEDESGTISKDELINVFRALGYEPDPQAIVEAAEEASVSVESDLGLSELWQIVAGFRAREGFINDDLKDIRQTFDHYAGKDRMVSTSDVGKILRRLGFPIPLELQQDLADKVDITHRGKLDLVEVRKLIRMYNGRKLTAVKEMLKGHRSLEVAQARAMLQELNCVGEDGEVVLRQEFLMRLPHGGFRVSIKGFTANVLVFWKERRCKFKERCGFEARDVQELQALFSSYDKDNSGEIGRREIIPLIEHHFPALANDKAMRPQLLAILQECDSDNSGSLDFGDFLLLMQRVQEMQDNEKIVAEEQAREASGFSAEEVKDLRELFLTNCEEGSFELAKTHIVDILCRGCTIRRTQLHEFAEIFHSVTENPETKVARDVCEFPEFLLLIRKLLEVNFGGITALYNKA